LRLIAQIAGRIIAYRPALITSLTPLSSNWQSVGNVTPTELVDARLQLHYALQIIVSAPISFLAKRADDSHTNLEWLPTFEALGTNWLERPQRVRFALRPASLALLTIDEGGSIASKLVLDAKTSADGVEWLRQSLNEFGYDGAALTTKKHYEIPPHPVASGAAYDCGKSERFAEWRRYYADAHELASSVCATRTGASPPRCWPHHFDLATLITLSENPGREKRTVGVGMSPGDDSYSEPYFYVGPYPHPPAERLRPFGSLGTWHTQGWVGAVLRASEVASFADAARQAEAVHTFADVAIDASIEALS
jgi:hypothetical protein